MMTALSLEVSASFSLMVFHIFFLWISEQQKTQRCWIQTFVWIDNEMPLSLFFFISLLWLLLTRLRACGTLHGWLERFPSDGDLRRTRLSSSSLNSSRQQLPTRSGQTRSWCSARPRPIIRTGRPFRFDDPSSQSAGRHKSCRPVNQIQANKRTEC